VKVRVDQGPREVELGTLDWTRLPWVELPDLAQVLDRELLRDQRHVLAEVFAANGRARMAAGVRVLDPLQKEMRRRGLKALYWTMETKERSDRAFRADDN
jgi:hypothetical protein